MTTAINGAMLRKMVINGAKLLNINKDHVDALNVFPIPDGDTGTNMTLTITGSASAVFEANPDDMQEVCSFIVDGALNEASGNSGSILSEILRGMCSEFLKHKTISTTHFATALKKGTEAVYKVVKDPKEGTMLTVVRVMSESAPGIAKKHKDFEKFFTELLSVGEEILDQTPEMLPVLKKAGVVDAGGRGLLIILQGFYNQLVGKEEELVLKFNDNTNGIDGSAMHLRFKHLDEIVFPYCTEFFVINTNQNATDKDINKLREKLEKIGDCVLVIGDISKIKVHVHTDRPDKALGYGLEMGELYKPKIENMLEQNRRLVGGAMQELKAFGFVSICAGEGIMDIFKGLSVDEVLMGGQTMNPSAGSIASLCDKVQANDVFVLPNNKNIILACEQAKALSKRNIHIIPTLNIPQGIASVLAFNEEETLENNIDAMTQAMSSVATGMVTYAVRKANIDSLELNEGDIMGLDSKSIVCKGDNVALVTTELVDKIITKDANTIALYYGSDVTEEDASALATQLESKYPDCEVDVFYGGQPLYYYIVSVE